MFITAASFSQLLIGPEAGANFNYITYDDIDLKNAYHSKPVWGYNVGMHGAFKVRKRFFLHFSFLYSTKGKNITGDQGLTNKVRYNYIDVPVAYTIDFIGKLGPNKVFKYTLGAGPNISYWLGGKGTIENFDTDEFSTGKVPYHIVFNKSPADTQNNQMTIEHFNRVQLGLNVMASIIFSPVPNREIMLTMRYELGHSFLSKDSNGHFNETFYEDQLKMRNNGIRLSLSYLIDLKLDQRKRGKSTFKKKNF